MEAWALRGTLSESKTYVPLWGEESISGIESGIE